MTGGEIDALAEDDTALESYLARGGDPDAADPDGRTALMACAGRGGWRGVELLLAAGADARRKDKRGDSPLHWAARSGVTEVVVALAAAGADPNARNDSWQPPAQAAALSGSLNSLSVVRALVECGARLGTEPWENALVEAGGELGMTLR